ncbi:hypothetical protein CDL15_Pgr016606 [Punica granatum]|uniref:3'-5' exonuclease domain-containing protein n=1 Tax=Punica granatum TaxID=22663 RepID=A0A218XSV2_PUNGR|nr:hypothetical protein CDL15_Pgr016606 [Punica granatum]
MAVTVTYCNEVAYGHWVYTVDFFGIYITTTVTSDPGAMHRWIYSATRPLRNTDHPIIGLGVQWYNSEHSDCAATFQLCVGRRCLIVQLTHATEVPAVLRNFLLNPAYTFVGVWNHSDAWRLKDCRHQLRMARRPVDLRLCLPGMKAASFETIVREWLGYHGVRLERQISVSDWEAAELHDDQVKQATFDAFLSLRIGMMIEAWNYVTDGGGSTEEGYCFLWSSAN